MTMQELYAKPNSWCRGADAKDSPKGWPVTFDAPEARCFCLRGAGRRCGLDLTSLRARLVAAAVRMKLIRPSQAECFGLVSLNDGILENLTQVRALVKEAGV